MDDSGIIWYVYFTPWMHLLHFNSNANKPFVCVVLFSTLLETARENKHLGNNFLECFAYRHNRVTGLYRHLDINYVNGLQLCMVKGKTKYTTLSEQFENIPHCQNSSKIYHTVRTVRKSNRKIVDRGKIDTTNTQRHDL